MDQTTTPVTEQKKLSSWKREFCVLLIGIVCGGTLFAIYSFFTVRQNIINSCEHYLENNLLLTYETDLPYDEAVSLFEKQASTIPGWSVTREYCKLPGNIAVFKMCHKEYAKRLLNTDDRRSISAILPCSFTIFPLENGKTRLVRINGALVEKIADSNDSTATFKDRIMPEQDILLQRCGFKQVKR